MAQREFEGLSAEEELEIKDRAMDEAPIGITLADPAKDDNPMVYINEAFEDLTGYDADEVIGRNCRFLQGPATDADAPDRMREAIDAREPVSVELLNYRKDGEPFWNQVTVAPVHDDDGELSHFVGFQKDVTARKQAERALDRERERLDHLVDRIEGFVADVTADVIEADSRDAVDAVLCERVAATEPYTAARVLRRRGDGDYDVAASDDGDGDRVPAVEPLDRVAETGEPVVVAADDWRSAVDDGWLSADAVAVASVPVTYGDVDYGQLVIAAESDVDEREIVVLRSLATTAATAINALERGRMLTAPTALELRFALPDADVPLARLAAEAGGRWTVEQFVRRDAGDVSAVVSTDADADAREAGMAALDVEVGTLRSDDDGAVLELRLDDPGLFDAVGDRAGEVVGLEVTDGVLELTVRAPHRNAARAIRDVVVERYPEAELLGSTEVEPAVGGDGDGLLDDLTGKQREALQKAFYGGYFDRPRPVTGDDLAETMGISRATFNQHLRTAERKVLAAAFDDGD